jgi:WD40 repeat protein
VEWQLQKARQRLRSRLTRRGLAPASPLFTGLVAHKIELSHSAIRAALGAIRGTAAVSAEAAALAGEVLSAIGMAKLRTVAAVLALAMVAVGTFGLAMGMNARKEPLPQPQVAVSAPRDEARSSERSTSVNPVKRELVHNRFPKLGMAALSPRGTTFACVAGNTDILNLFDLQSGQMGADFVVVSKLKDQTAIHEGKVHALAFSPDGTMVATAGYIRNIRLWDVTSRAEQVTLQGSTVLTQSMVFSPDGKSLATASGGIPAAFDKFTQANFSSLEEIRKNKEYFTRRGEVKVWDLTTRKERTFFSDTHDILHVTFSPDGKNLASGEDGGTIRLFDVATGKERSCWRQPGDSARAMAFSPDGKTLAVVRSLDGSTVQLWDVASERVRLRLGVPAGRINTVAFSPDGTLATAAVLTGGSVLWENAPGEIRLWDSVTGCSLGEPLTCDHCLTGIAFDGHGKVLAAWKAGFPSDGRLTLWDLVSAR